jgi:hypothetical protein
VTAADRAREFADALDDGNYDNAPAIAALLRELAAGFTPREPTNEMIDAGVAAASVSDTDWIRIRWRAMHDAATGRKEG